MNKEELRKTIIKAPTIKEQKKVVNWLKSQGEKIYFVTEESMQKGRTGAHFTFGCDDGEWLRYGRHSLAISLEEAQAKFGTRAFPITREALKEIHPNVCSTWKNEIEDIIKQNPLEDSFIVPEYLIRQAYKEASVYQKDWLDEHFPELMFNMEIGKWYERDGILMCYQGLGGTSKFDIKGFGISPSGNWAPITYWEKPFDWKPAKPEDVLEALTKEAKRRGLCEGVVVKHKAGRVGTLKGEFRVNEERGYFCMGEEILLFFEGERAGEWSDEIVKPEIDYDKLKTGSQVKIRKTDQMMINAPEFDDKSPVEIVFYRTPHYIDGDKMFNPSGFYEEYITFYQNGNYILFASDEGIDYITEVIEY